MLTNKVPLLRNLQWNLVIGSNALYVNQTNNYVEIFAGLENIFKLFRVDVIGSYLNGNTGQVGVRVGFDGLFGTAIGNALKNPECKTKAVTLKVWEYGSWRICQLSCTENRSL